MNAPKEEIDLLNLKRKSEGKEFQENLKFTSNNFYALDLEWFLQWKSYVMNDFSEKNLPNNKKRISLNKEIGVLPPGQISNKNLFDNSEIRNFKKSLKKVKT